MANTFRNDTYRANGVFANTAVGLLSLIALSGIIYIIASILMIALPDNALTLKTGAQLNVGFLLIGLTAFFVLFLRLLTAIFFLIWLHRAFNNLSALKAQNLEFSPGWAVGWWFIPFANLVKPFQVIRELWNESDPNFDQETGFLNTSAGTPEIVGFWWGAFLLSGFVGRLSDGFIDSQTGETSTYFPVVMMLVGIFTSIAAVLALIIVREVTRKQEERFQKILKTQQIVPPPPTFDRND